MSHYNLPSAALRAAILEYLKRLNKPVTQTWVLEQARMNGFTPTDDRKALDFLGRQSKVEFTLVGGRVYVQIAKGGVQ